MENHERERSKSPVRNCTSKKIADTVTALLKSSSTDKEVTDNSKKSSWDFIKQNSVKELVNNFNKLQYLDPEVTLRPKNVYTNKPINRNSKVRWSVPMKENNEEDFCANSSDEDIAGTYVTRIDIQENQQHKTEAKKNLLSPLADDAAKTNRSSLERIREKNIVKLRLEEFSTVEDSVSLQTNTGNKDFFNTLKTKLQRCPSMIMQSETSDNSDYEEAEEWPETQEDNNNNNNNVSCGDLKEEFQTRVEDEDTTNEDDEHERLVLFYRDVIERLCCFPFALAAVYCSCHFLNIILEFLIYLLW